ncbi:MAG: SPOR domain-containing protein [Halioglobus sp.]
MKEERGGRSRSSSQPLPGFSGTHSPADKRDVPPFSASSDRDAFEGYDEPDRDRDIAAGFREELFDEDEAFEDLLPEDLEVDDASLFREQSEFLRAQRDTAAGRPPAKDRNIEWDEEDNAPLTARDWDDAGEEEEDWREDTWSENDDWPDDETELAASADEWRDEEGYPVEEQEHSGGLPLGLIAVGIIALILVMAGGYGIVQQRAATQEEIVELRAELATAVSPDEVNASRAALQEANERNFELVTRARELELENRRLIDTIAGLEAQIQAAAGSATGNKPAAGATKPAVTAASRPAAKPAQPAAASPAKPPAADGDWFVNFGSYGQREAAQQWTTRLKPGAGKVIVAEGSRNGNTFYRVRVVGLADRAAADAVARKLEKDWGLSKLWVGNE